MRAYLTTFFCAAIILSAQTVTSTYAVPRDTLNVASFGAVADGTTDNTAAFQRWATAGSAQNMPLSCLDGTYKITDTITFAAGTRIYGNCTIKFAPSSSKTAWKFTRGDTSANVGNIIYGINFDASGNTQTKVALELNDIRQSEVSGVKIDNWTSTGKDAVGIKIKGRDTSSIHDTSVFADIPFDMYCTPNETIVCLDHFHFYNLYTQADQSQSTFKFANTVFMTNMTWDGYQAWVFGTYGMYWNATSAAQPSYNINLHNIRWEQSDQAGYAFYLNPGQYSYALNFVNNTTDSRVDGGPYHNFVYLRNWRSGRLDSNHWTGLGVALNLDSTDSLAITNNFLNLNLGATLSITGFQGLWCNNDGAGANGQNGKCGYGVANPTGQIVVPNNTAISGLSNAGAEVAIAKIDPGNNHVALASGGNAAYFGGTVTANGDLPTGGNPFVVPNTQYYSSVNAAGNNAVQLLGADSSNRVILAPNPGNAAYTNSSSWCFGGPSGSGHCLYSYAGDPNGNVTGVIGDLCLNTNGGANVTLWVKESGIGTNTGWVAK